MIEIKLFDSELKVMEVLWENGDTPAKEVSDILNESIGWNKNTTYTIIKKCIDKGAIERIEPKFICKAVVSKAEVQAAELNELTDKMFGGSADMLVASLLDSKQLTKEEFERLKKLVEELK